MFDARCFNIPKEEVTNNFLFKENVIMSNIEAIRNLKRC